MPVTCLLALRLQKVEPNRRRNQHDGQNQKNRKEKSAAWSVLMTISTQSLKDRGWELQPGGLQPFVKLGTNAGGPEIAR